MRSNSNHSRIHRKTLCTTLIIKIVIAHSRTFLTTTTIHLAKSICTDKYTKIRKSMLPSLNLATLKASPPSWKRIQKRLTSQMLISKNNYFLGYTFTIQFQKRSRLKRYYSAMRLTFHKFIVSHSQTFEGSDFYNKFIMTTYYRIILHPS